MITIKKLFIVLGFCGMIIISILAFIIPDNPYEIVPAMTIMSFDKPIWLCYVVGGGFLYLALLSECYDVIMRRIKREV